MQACDGCTHALDSDAQVGQKLKDALAAGAKAPVVVELDWKESVLHEDDRRAHTLPTHHMHEDGRHARTPHAITCTRMAGARAPLTRSHARGRRGCARS
jgi:hypothetical protein